MANSKMKIRPAETQKAREKPTGSASQPEISSMEAGESAPSIKDESRRAIFAMLSRMTSYFCSMVDPSSDRFYYRCLPDSGRRIHGHCPIRDLGSAWDTGILISFWDEKSDADIFEAFASASVPWIAMKERLSRAVLATCNAYKGPWHTFKTIDGMNCIALESKILQEPSNIAHSAFLLLATSEALKLSILNPTTCTIPIDNLVNGILSMQIEESGAFAIHFGSSDIYRGIEFYPGEALLALLDVLQHDAIEIRSSKEVSRKILSQSTRESILSAAMRAFKFYSSYYRKGNVAAQYTSFFGNWQVQCFSRLYDILHENEKVHISTTPKDVTSEDVAKYIFELCNDICSSHSWHQLMKGNFRNLATVEISCGLEALADGTRIALQLSPDSPLFKDIGSAQLIATYWKCIDMAVYFLATIQNQVADEAVGEGGLGHALHLSEQRLDVTGHAISALTKVYELQQSSM